MRNGQAEGRGSGGRCRAGSRSVGFALLGLLCLPVTGCRDLPEVAALGTVAAGAAAAFPQISDDVYASCERRAALVRRIPPGELPADAAGTVPDCAPARAVAAKLRSDEAVLTDYVAALAKLGSGAAFGYGKALAADVATVSDLSAASRANAVLAGDAQRAGEAALTLADKVADLAQRRLRAREVRRLVTEANPGVQALTAALYQAGFVDYGILLGDERGVLQAYYAGPMAAAGKADRLTLILVQRQYDDDELALTRRQAAAAEYGTVLRELGALHAKLSQAAVNGAGFGDRLKQLAPELKQLQADVAKLQVDENRLGVDGSGLAAEVH